MTSTDQDPQITEALRSAAEEIAVGTPDYRGRVRASIARRAVVAVAALGVVSALVVGVVSVNQSKNSGIATSPGTAPLSSAPMELQPSTGSFQPGETIHVTGTGCPPSGPVDLSGGAVGVTLSQTGAIPGYSVSSGDSGSTISVSNYLGILPGQVNLATTPRPDGTWGLDLTIPQDAPPADDYTIGALCATLLELDATGLAVDPASVTQASVTSGPLTVEERTTPIYEAMPATVRGVLEPTGLPAPSEFRLVDVSDSYYDQMTLELTEGVSVVSESGATLDADDLSAGTTVDVWTGQGCDESYPVQCGIVAVRVAPT